MVWTYFRVLLFEKIIKNQKEDIVVEDVLKHLKTVYGESSLEYFE